MVDDRRPFPMTPGFLIGVAVAGFFDGILLHQILQWHHMICIETPLRRYNGRYPAP